jgi:hypothetical protein
LGVELRRDPVRRRANKQDRLDLEVFDCAPRMPAETAAQEAIRRLAQVRYAKHERMLVFRDADTGDLAGAVHVQPRALTTWVPDSMYVTAIALTGPFRGATSPAGRVSVQMLEHALATISRLHDGQAPIVWAAIDNSNTASQKLFGEFGFEPVPGLLSRGLVAWARDAAA